MFNESTYPLWMAGTLLLMVIVYILDYALSLRTAATTERQGKRLKKWICPIIFITTFVTLYLLNEHEYVFYNNYSYLAESWMKGRLYVVDFPAWLESVEFGGRQYMHFAPGSALLHLPFVMLFGVQGFNTAWLSFLIGSSNAVLFYKVFERMSIGKTVRQRLWCTALAVFGTVHCFLAALGHSWFIGHISTLFYLLLGMYFITDKSNGEKRFAYTFLAGLFYGLSVTCRLSNLLGGLFFLGYVLFCKDRKDLLKNCIYFVVGAAIPGVLYMVYNYVRYGTIMDISYNLTHLKDYFRDMYNEMQLLPTKAQQLAYLRAAEAEVGGALQLQFVPYNLYSIFLMPPEFSPDYPYIIPSITGVCVTILSPALLFGIVAGWRGKRKWLCITLLVTAVISAVPFLLNYGNGTAQFGMRYAMDFIPFLTILAAMGICKKELTPLKRIAILYCIFVNIWGPVYWNCFY